MGRTKQITSVSFNKELFAALKKHIDSIRPTTDMSKYLEHLIEKDAIEKGYLPEQLKQKIPNK